MTNTQEQEGTVRLEDFMKDVLENAEPISKTDIQNSILDFVNSLPNTPKHLLLTSSEVNYYQVFTIEGASAETISAHILDYLQESYVTNEAGDLISMANVIEMENPDLIDGLDIWIGAKDVRPIYFQLAPFDWGVEVICEN